MTSDTGIPFEIIKPDFERNKGTNLCVNLATMELLVYPRGAGLRSENGLAPFFALKKALNPVLTLGDVMRLPADAFALTTLPIKRFLPKPHDTRPHDTRPHHPTQSRPSSMAPAY